MASAACGTDLVGRDESCCTAGVDRLRARVDVVDHLFAGSAVLQGGVGADALANAANILGFELYMPVLPGCPEELAVAVELRPRTRSHGAVCSPAGGEGVGLADCDRLLYA